MKIKKQIADFEQAWGLIWVREQIWAQLDEER